MHSYIIYKEEQMELCDDFMEVGFMGENITVDDFYGNPLQIKRSHSDQSMTLLLSFPSFSNGFREEILKLDAFLSHITVPTFTYLLFDAPFEEQTALKNHLNRLEIVFDTHGDFGSMYGTQIVSGSLENKLTKSLFLISKDGAIFYLDMPENLEIPFGLERLQVELNKAYISYTGAGCHG